MKSLLLLSLIIASLFSQGLIGKWKLKSQPLKPFNFANTIAYEAIFKFNEDGTLHLIGSNGNIMGSVRFYNISGNRLTTYLNNPNQGSINNFLLGKLSSSTFILKPTANNCIEAISDDKKSNPFTMCK